MANEKRLFDGEYKFIERHFNKRLIDAEAIERKLKNAHCVECNVVRQIQCSACWVNDVLELLEGDVVDAVEVVRCKDCEHRYTAASGVIFCTQHITASANDDDFCSYGERREGE